MSALFFLATAVFWILKPLKKGIFISHFKDNVLELGAMRLGGAEAEQLAKLTLVAAALVAAVLLAFAARRFSLRKIFVTITLLAAGSALYFAVFLPAGRAGDGGGFVVWLFYLFGDIQYSLLIALLWSVLHDSFRVREAKYAFTLIVVSGLAGGLGGTFFVQQTLALLGRETIIAFCVPALLLIAVLGYGYLCKVRRAEKSRFSGEPASTSSSSCENFASEKSDGRLWSFGKPGYWIAVALLVGLYELTSGIIDFQLSLMVEKLGGGEIQRTVIFSYVGAAQNLAALLFQILFTGYIIRRWGMKSALLVLPLTILFGSVALFFVPGLAGAMFLAVSDNSLNYSLNQQAKETLYLPTAREERFRAKAFIDLFVQRFAKIAAVALNLIIVSIAGMNASRWLAAAAIPVLLIWIAVVQYTGREFENLSPGT